MSPTLARLIGGDGPGAGAQATGLAPLPDVGGMRIAIAADTMVDDVHFDHRTGPADLGYKVLAVNLSDMAAMGAVPHAASLALHAPSALLEPEPRGEWLEGLAAGLLGLADEHRVVWRGTTTCVGPLVVTVEIIGRIAEGGGLRRDGARPGDTIYVSGTLGDAGCALLPDFAPASAEDRRFLEGRLLRPTPRVAMGVAASTLANAAIDLSDGLSADLGHVASRSRVAALVHAEALPLSPALRRSVDIGTARGLAASAGDDYELVLTVGAKHEAPLLERARSLEVPLTPVGHVLEPDRAAPAGAVRFVDEAGRDWRPGPGYAHFA